MSRPLKLEEQVRNVTDPRDFLRTRLPELVDLDTLLRCHICKDFIKSPVLTPCAHTFCSLCIREYLNRELRCPLCLAELRESMLKSEFLVSEVISSYMEMRSKLLDILDSKKVVLEGDTSIVEILPSCDEREIVADDDDLQIIETRESRPAKRNAETVMMNSKRIRKEPGKSSISSMFGKSKSPAPQEEANCPICQKAFPLQYLQGTHLDDCLTNGALEHESAATSSPVREKSVQKTQPSTPNKLSSTPIPTPVVETKHSDRYAESGQNSGVARLAKLNFSSMSMQQLKQKLASLRLPVVGTRQQLVNRYNHFEMLWNSNFLDSMNPVPETELRRRLTSWEAAHNGSDSTTGKSSISKLLNKNSATRMKDFKTDKFDRKGWIVTHHREFKELIEDARQSLVKASKERKESNDKQKPPKENEIGQQIADKITGEDHFIPSNQLVVKPEQDATSSQSSFGL